MHFVSLLNNASSGYLFPDENGTLFYFIFIFGDRERGIKRMRVYPLKAAEELFQYLLFIILEVLFKVGT